MLDGSKRCCRDASVRTTVTLDADVKQMLKGAMKRGDKTFKKTLNDAVRRGLRDTGSVADSGFVVKACAMGLRPGIDPAQVRDLDDELELQEFVRKTRALEAAKE